MSSNRTSAILEQIQEASAKLESWYAELQHSFELVEYVPEQQLELASGVNNRSLPVHRWFNLKEAYSAYLPLWVMEFLRNKYDFTVNRVLDPFVGGGTTGVTLVQQGVDVDGVEYNPFINFVATTKSQYSQMNKGEIQDAINAINLAALQIPRAVPPLSTFSNSKYFRPADVQILLNTIDQIQALEARECTRNFLLLGIAAAIDDVANLRKDGRALRYTNKPERPSASQAISSHWNCMLSDLGTVQYKGVFNIYSGTALALDFSPATPTYDLALYSPPYLNNFDYSEVYKLELWLLGFLQNTEQWRSLRRSTIRSHPSIRFIATDYLSRNSQTKDIVTHLWEMESSTSLLSERARRDMTGVITGYFDDMYLALCQQWQLLKPGGFLVYVVANSRHNWLPIATDIILGSIAQQIGFQPLDLVVLRHRNGRTRQKAYLRESAVFMRKPIG